MFKKLVLSSLATLSVTLLLLTSLPAFAKNTSEAREQSSIDSAMVMPKSSLNNQREDYALVTWTQNHNNQLEPNNLVELAYRGAFKDRGIASYNTFMSEIREGELTAKNLVKSAISDRQLPPNTIDNSKYLNEVNMALQDFARFNR